MHLQLSDQQARALRTLLERALGDLSYEISDTDNPAFKRQLREERELMVELVQQLTAGAPPAER